MSKCLYSYILCLQYETGLELTQCVAAGRQAQRQGSNAKVAHLVQSNTSGLLQRLDYLKPMFSSVL